MNVKETSFVDENFLREIMDRHGTSLLKLVYSYVKNWTTAEDIVQETFITFAQKHHQFKGKSSLKTWLYQIAINKSKDFLRSPKNKVSQFSFSKLVLTSKERNVEEKIMYDDESHVENTFYKNPIVAQEIEKAFAIDITNVFVLDDNELGNFIEINNEIHINNEFDFEHGNNLFNEGLITLKEGQELVDFTSMRKSDPRNYDGRDARVVLVLEELFKQEKFYSDILKKEINKFDEVLLSSRNIKLDDSIVFEEQYVDGVYSKKISGESLEVLKQSFGQ